MTHPADKKPPDLVIEDWGLVDYGEALARQHARVAARLRGEIPDTFIFCQHYSVMTLGRGTDRANILVKDVPIFEVERGGDVTWHGPGQLVGYFIRLLPEGTRDLRAHLRLMEEVVIRAMASAGLRGFRTDGKTGVWVHHDGVDRKIASLVIAARNWCTYHGFALNVNPDLSNFRRINPCGFDAGVMTSTSACGNELPLSDWEILASQSLRSVMSP